VRNGYVQRPKLGIEPRNVEALSGQVRLPVSYGVLIMAVQPGGAAANAGLRGLVQTENGDVELGDIIVAINGQKISNNDELFGVLDQHQVGETVNVEVIRNGRHTTVPVKLMEAPQRRQGIRE
jgi:S1-C subfamily serine protease